METVRGAWTTFVSQAVWILEQYGQILLNAYGDH